MTEKDFYRRFVRPAFHRPPESAIWRVEDYGLPDTIARTGDVTFALELKTLEHLPVRAGTPFRIGTTVEQRRTLAQWNRTGSYPTAFVLMGIAREGRFYLLDPETPSEIEQDRIEEYLWGEGPLDPEQIRGAVLEIVEGQ